MGGVGGSVRGMCKGPAHGLSAFRTVPTCSQPVISAGTPHVGTCIRANVHTGSTYSCRCVRDHRGLPSRHLKSL